MINPNAVALLNEWWETYSDTLADIKSISHNLEIYKRLSREFKSGSILQNYYCQWVFASFYGMSRVQEENRAHLFEKMEVIRNHHDGLNALDITEELRNRMGKNYFSFTTKMLNLLDDTQYPIYDSIVAGVFSKPFLPGETRLHHQMAVYEDIRDTYIHLDHHPMISQIRKLFDCEEVGYMKILDSVYWTIGKNKMEEEEE